jgi:hypothetical protein
MGRGTLGAGGADHALSDEPGRARKHDNIGKERARGGGKSRGQGGKHCNQIRESFFERGTYLDCM